MAYRVVLSRRALADLSRLYKRIGARENDEARVWFEGLETRIRNLDENPRRGVSMREDGQRRQLVYGQGRNIYRVIYEVDVESLLVKVLHVRFGARKDFDPKAISQ